MYIYLNYSRWLLTTQFQPTHARSVFPCWDEPRFKTVVQLSITIPHEYSAMSNTAASSTVVST